MDKKVRRMLIESARQNRPLVYSDVMRLIKLDHHEPDHRKKFSKILEDISRYEHSKGRPMLSAQIMYRGLDEIGGRFYWLASELNYGKEKKLAEDFFEIEMMKRCHAFWIDENHYRQFLNDDGSPAQPAAPGSNILLRVEVPTQGVDKSLSHDFDFTGRDVDWIAVTTENITLGSAGEALVIEYEKEVLTTNGRKDLADKVDKVKDGKGYDILSFYADGKEKYIEVKTSNAGKDSVFPITANEIAFSETHPAQYHLYWLFNFSADKRPIEFFEFKGDLNPHFSFEGLVFKARRKSKL